MQYSLFFNSIQLQYLKKKKFRLNYGNEHYVFELLID